MKRRIVSLILGISLILTGFASPVDSAENSTVTITFVGDCTLGGYKGQGTSGNYNEFFDNYGADYFLGNVRPIFEKDDITFINLEGALTSHPTVVDKQFPISCRPEHVGILSNSSIEVCGLSNNHTYDCGVDGYNDTIELLTSNGIGYCDDSSVWIQRVDDFSIACLSYNGWSADKVLLDDIQNKVQSLKASGVSIVCIMFHWGTERENYSNSVQEKLAHHAIDSGADIVIGSHPHVIQGIEVYKGKTICYSMGNFTFGANKNPKDKDTFIFQQTFDYSGNTVSYEIIPCSISSESSRNNYQPAILEGTDAERVISRLEKYSSGYENTVDFARFK